MINRKNDLKSRKSPLKYQEQNQKISNNSKIVII